jgi:hypothetical protein
VLINGAAVVAGILGGFYVHWLAGIIFFAFVLFVGFADEGRKMKHLLAAIAITLCVAYGLRPTLTGYQAAPTATLIPASPPGGMAPVEEPRFVHQFEQVHTLAQSSKWWTGSWAMGPDFPYYRPLTSVVWWLQFRAFGVDGLAPFLIIHALWHIAVALALLGFLSALTGKRTAIAAVCLFTSGVLHDLLGVATSQYALTKWIDDPDLSCSLFIVLALWAWLRYLRADGKWWTAAALYVVAVLWKESAYVVPLFAVLLMWHERTWRREWFWLAGITVVLVALRTWALGGGGYSFGSNGAWWPKFVTETQGGMIAQYLCSGDTLHAVPVALVAAAFMAYRRRWAWAAGWCVVGVVTFAVYYRFSQSIEYRWAIVFSSAFVWKAVYLGFMGVVTAQWWRSGNRAQWLGYGWILVAYAPMLHGPVTTHGLYFVAVGWALWAAAAVAAMVPKAVGFRWPVLSLRSLRPAAEGAGG